MKKEWAVLIDGKVFGTFGTFWEAKELMLYITHKNRERRKFRCQPWSEGKRTLAWRYVSVWHKENLGRRFLACKHYFHDGRRSGCSAIEGQYPECKGRVECGMFKPDGGQP